MQGRQAHLAAWKTSGINRETEGNLESTTEEEHSDAGLPSGKAERSARLDVRFPMTQVK